LRDFLSFAKSIFQEFSCNYKGDIGAAKLTSEVLSIMTSVPQVVKTMTGVDITATMTRGGMGSSRVSFCPLRPK